MSRGQRFQMLKSGLRGSVWALPTFAVTVAVVAGLVLGQVEAEPQAWGFLVFDGGASAARSLLGAIATSLITVTSLTFSLMVLVLQNAASQYSPRLLRGFLADLKNQTVLAVFLSTFAFAVVVLPSIRDEGVDNGEEFVPRLAVTVSLLLTIASIAALVLLISNMTQSIRVESIMRDVRDDTVSMIRSNLSHVDGTATVDAPRPDPPPDVALKTLRARESGYIQSISGALLVDELRESDAVLVYRRTVGEQVVQGAPMALAWSTDGAVIPIEELEDALADHTQIGYERTLQEDIAFGLRQLTDIALKALSTGVNDPSTAVDALGRLSAILRELSEHQLGAELHHDEDGRLRVGVPRPRFADYLDLVVEPVSRYGESDLGVVTQLLRILEDLGAVVHTEVRRAAVMDAIDLVVRRAHGAMELPHSIERVERAARQARDSVRGEPPPRDIFVL